MMAQWKTLDNVELPGTGPGGGLWVSEALAADNNIYYICPTVPGGF